MDLQSLGRMLRQRREERELSLEDAESTLRIRRHILESFELGEFDLSGFSPVQINGFIRNYARWLGLDEDGVVDSLAVAKDETLRRSRRRGSRATQEVRTVQAAQDARSTQELRMSGPARVNETHPTIPVRPSARPANGTSTNWSSTAGAERRGGGFLRGLLFAALAVGALVLIGFVVFQFVTTTPIGEFDSIAPDGILSTMPAVATFTLAPTLTAQPSPTPNNGAFFSGAGVAVQITLAQRSWLRIEVDGAERFEGIGRPGTLFEFAASSTISVRAANAAALEVVYNGQRQNTFGARGQRVDLTFSPSGVQISSGQSFNEPTLAVTETPVPTSPPEVGTLIAVQTPSATPGPSPTATDTPPPTETPTITFTPSLTFTPSATLTPSFTPSATSTPGPSPTATAILPVREPLFTPTATKTG